MILAEDEAILFYDIRDWPGAARAGDRVLGLAPNSPSFRFMRGAIDFWMKNDPAPLRAAAALPAEADPDGLVTFMRWDAALLVRDFPAAERALVDKITPPVISFTSQSLPLSYLRGGIALARGEPALAREHFEATLPTFEADVRVMPLEFTRRGQLGLLYAYLGRKEEAIREGRRGVELAFDAVTTPSAVSTLALILARAGEVDEALALIERLLTMPSATGYGFEVSISLPTCAGAGSGTRCAATRASKRSSLRRSRRPFTGSLATYGFRLAVWVPSGL